MTSIAASAKHSVLDDTVLSLTYPDGRVVTQGFDAAGRLSTVNYAYWQGTYVGANYLTVNSYDAAGHAISANMGGSAASLASGYNSRLELGSLAYAAGSSTAWSKHYSWQANGN